jgi:hypothetical protein
MEKQIMVYGVADKEEFPTPDDLVKYISHDVFEMNSGRFHYTQNKNAEIIILSRDGLAYGHFEISGKEKPNQRDFDEFKKTKCTYVVETSTVYGNPVNLYGDFGILVKSFGTRISEEQFCAILSKADCH